MPLPPSRSAAIPLAILALAGAAAAQPPCDAIQRDTAELTTTPTLGSVAGAFQLVTFRAEGWFVASRPGMPLSIWRTDGTPAGTRWALDAPLAGATSLAIIGATADALYLAASAGAARSLWTTDGTPAGTVMFEPAYAGPLDPALNPVLITGDHRAIYTTGSEVIGVRTVGDAPVREILAPVRFASTVAPVRIGDLFVFAVHGGDADASELWATDATATGTVRLRDWSGSGSSFDRASELVAAGGRFFFSAGDAPAGRELWSTDGTPEGTRREADLSPGPADSTIILIGAGADKAWYNVSSDLHDGGVWLDSNGAGVHFLPVGISRGINPNPTPILDLGDGRIVFAGYRNGFNVPGLEPFVSDGTTDGTILLADIVPGGGDSMYVTQPAGIVIGGGGTGLTAQAIFCVDVNSTSTAGGEELWITDGTPSGTRLLQPRPSPSSAWAIFTDGRRAYFPDNGLIAVTDGSAPGAPLIPPVTPDRPEYSAPSSLIRLADRMVFSASDALAGREPWSTDGTGPGTLRLADIAGGSPGSPLIGLTTAGARAAYFLPGSAWFWNAGSAIRPVSIGGFNGNGWRATAALGPLLLIDSGNQVRVIDTLAPADAPPTYLPVSTSGSSAAQRFAPLGSSRMVFRAGLNVPVPTGQEPAVTDGTVEGTLILRDIAPISTGSNPYGFTSLGERVVFFASDPAAGAEPWVTDGTEAGTLRLADVLPGPQASPVPHPDQSTAVPAVFGGEAYMVLAASPGVSGLYATDGLTLRQVDIGGLRPSPPIVATTAGVFFAAPDPAGGQNVHISTGQPGGTRLAADLNNLNVFQLWPWGDGDARVLIETSSPARFLWVADGDAANSAIVLGPMFQGASISDCLPGAGGADGAHYLGVRAGTFSGIVRIDGAAPAGSACVVEPWTTTPNINGHPGYALTRCNSRIFLAAGDATAGLEPRAIDLCPADIDNSGESGVQDIFDYLFLWFEQHPAADFDGQPGIGLEDLFAFLRAWFAGCHG